MIGITKFEKDYLKNNRPPLEYRFLNAYPISIDSMPVSYEGAQTLKCTVNFNFSRYITGATRPNAISYPTTGETTDSSSWVGGEWRNHTTGGNSLIASTNRGASDVLDWEARMKAKGITLSKTGRIDDI